MYPDSLLNEKRIMAIDYGEKRIGVALSDPLLTFAYPYLTLNNDASLTKNLKQIIKEKKIVKIILGQPSSSKKNSVRLLEKINSLGDRLKSDFNLEVIFWNEDYTSVIAQQRILETVPGKMKRRNKSLIDQNSAAIILEEYLNSL